MLRITPRFTSVSAILGVALTLVLTVATPAFAHGADAPDATNYRTTITSTPDLPGLRVTTIEAGARLELTNHSGRTVEVLGYSGEPYLEVRPDGVYENIHSPATYLNITIAHVDPPAHADPTVAPEWRKVNDDDFYRWHDQRAIWTDTQPPAEVAAAPDQQHRIRQWTVPMRVDVTPLQVDGVLDWVPPPSPVLWWALSVAGAAVIALLGLIRGRPRSITVLLAALTLTAGGAALAYAIAREIDAGNHTVGSILIQLFTAQLWPVVSALAAIAAAVYSLTRRAASDFALALGAAAGALFAGMVNAAVFHRSIVPVPWPATTARIVIAAIIALGAGVAVAGMLRLRETSKPPAPQTQAGTAKP